MGMILCLADAGAERIASQQSHAYGVNPTLRVTPLKRWRSFRGIRPVGGLPGSDRRGRITPLFFDNVLDKKQQSAIISTKALDRFLAVSPHKVL